MAQSINHSIRNQSDSSNQPPNKKSVPFVRTMVSILKPQDQTQTIKPNTSSSPQVKQIQVMSSQFSAGLYKAKGSRIVAQRMESILNPCRSSLEKNNLSPEKDSEYLKFSLKPHIPVTRENRFLPCTNSLVSGLQFPVKMGHITDSNKIDSMTPMPSNEVNGPIAFLRESASVLLMPDSEQKNLAKHPMQMIDEIPMTVKIESHPIDYGEDVFPKAPLKDNNFASFINDSVMTSQSPVKSEADTTVERNDPVSFSHLSNSEDKNVSESISDPCLSIKMEIHPIDHGEDAFAKAPIKDNNFASFTNNSAMMSQFPIKSEADTTAERNDSISFSHLSSIEDKNVSGSIFDPCLSIKMESHPIDHGENAFSKASLKDNNFDSFTNNSAIMSQSPIKSEADTTVERNDSISFSHWPGSENNNVSESIFDPCLPIKMESHPIIQNECFIALPLKKENNFILCANNLVPRSEIYIKTEAVTNIEKTRPISIFQPPSYNNSYNNPVSCNRASSAKPQMITYEQNMINSSVQSIIQPSLAIKLESQSINGDDCVPKSQFMFRINENNPVFSEAVSILKPNLPLRKGSNQLFGVVESESTHKFSLGNENNLACSCDKLNSKTCLFVKENIESNALYGESDLKPAENASLIGCSVESVSNSHCVKCKIENPDMSDLIESNNLQNPPPSEFISTPATKTVKKSFVCEFCGKKFAKQYYLSRHSLIHTGVKNFACETCGTRFARKCHVFRHKRNVHNIPSQSEKQTALPEGSECQDHPPSQTISTLTALPEESKPQDHPPTETISTLISKEVEKLMCEICGIKFTQRSNLRRHALTHNGIKAFQCDICGARFRRKTNMLRHEVTQHTFSKNPEKTILSEVNKTQSQTPRQPLSTKFSEENHVKTVLPETNEHQAHTPSQPLLTQSLEEAKKVYICETCDKKFTFKQNLHRHRLIHAATKPFRCKTCDMQFGRKSSLDRHELTHTKFNCDKCGERFTKKTHWMDHFCDLSETKPYICNVCNAAFENLSLVTEHIQTHSGEELGAPESAKTSREANKPFACETCGMRFVMRSRLESHTLIHATVKAFACKECGKHFTTNKSLRVHLRIHTGEKPYVCPVCQASFTYSNSLLNHHRTHTGERPYHCNLCPATFTRSNALRFHRLIHTQEKAFFCEYCSRSFSRKTILAVHVLSRHSEVKPYPCDLCPRTFATKQILEAHSRSHSDSRPFPCKLCGKCFKTKFAMCTHTKSHTDERPLTCEHCGKGFRNKHCLENHIRTHTNERPFVCPICDYAFTQKTALDRHYRIHTGEKPFTCDVCNRAFNQRSQLNSHRLKHFKN